MSIENFVNVVQGKKPKKSAPLKFPTVAGIHDDFRYELRQQAADAPLVRITRNTKTGVTTKTESAPPTVKYAFSCREGKSNNPPATHNGIKNWRRASSYNCYHGSYEFTPGKRWMPSGSYIISEDGYFGQPNDLRVFDSPQYEGVNMIPPDFMAAAEADVRALNKLADAKLELGAELALMSQTASQMGEDARQLWLVALALKRKDFKGITAILRNQRSLPKWFSDKYLGLQYGYLPLVGSIWEGYKLINEGLSKGPFVRGRHTVYTQNSFTNSWNGWEKSHQFQRAHTTCITATMDQSWLANVNRVGLLNPLSVAWETVPWSFLIDWVIPVNEFLQALTAPAGLDFVDCYRTFRAYGEIKSECRGVSGWNITLPPTGKLRVMRLNRSRLTSWPIPRPYISSKPFWSAQRSANALNLMVSRNIK